MFVCLFSLSKSIGSVTVETHVAMCQYYSRLWTVGIARGTNTDDGAIVVAIRHLSSRAEAGGGDGGDTSGNKEEMGAPLGSTVGGVGAAAPPPAAASTYRGGVSAGSQLILT